MSKSNKISETIPFSATTDYNRQVQYLNERSLVRNVNLGSVNVSLQPEDTQSWRGNGSLLTTVHVNVLFWLLYLVISKNSCNILW